MASHVCFENRTISFQHVIYSLITFNLKCPQYEVLNPWSQLSGEVLKTLGGGNQMKAVGHWRTFSGICCPPSPCPPCPFHVSLLLGQPNVSFCLHDMSFCCHKVRSQEFLTCFGQAFCYSSAKVNKPYLALDVLA